MNHVSPSTLIISIRAVRSYADSLAQAMEEAEEPELSELEEEMLQVSKAEMDLRKVYEARQQAAGNLPAYEEIVNAR